MAGRILAAGVLALLGGCGTSVGRAIVQGTATDGGGTPIAGLEIEFHGPSENARYPKMQLRGGEVISDAKGEFRFTRGLSWTDWAWSGRGIYPDEFAFEIRIPEYTGERWLVLFELSDRELEDGAVREASLEQGGHCVRSRAVAHAREDHWLIDVDIVIGVAGRPPCVK
jgi:hypothetical protein